MTVPERRKAFVEAAGRVLLRKGMLAATTRDVTEETGVGVGLLNHYFTWHALRAEAFESLAHQDIERWLGVNTPGSAQEKLTAFVAAAFGKEADPMLRLWVEAYDLAATDAELAKRIRTCGDAWHAKLTALLAEGTRAGAWKCRDPAASSLRIIAMFDGLSSLMLAPGSRVSRQDASGHLRHLIELECPASARRKRSSFR